MDDGGDCFLRAEALVMKRMETKGRRMRRENKANSWRTDMAKFGVFSMCFCG